MPTMLHESMISVWCTASERKAVALQLTFRQQKWEHWCLLFWQQDSKELQTDPDNGTNIFSTMAQQWACALILECSVCWQQRFFLTVTLPYVYNFQPKTTLSKFSQYLPEHFNKKYLDMDYATLLDACSTVNIALSSDMAEKATRGQASCCLWFWYRYGRIITCTSPKMKVSCHTNPESPAQSLIKTICYPKAYRFKCEAALWGCNHEKSARNEYKTNISAWNRIWIVALAWITLIVTQKQTFLDSKPKTNISAWNRIWIVALAWITLMPITIKCKLICLCMKLSMLFALSLQTVNQSCTSNA